MPAPLKDIVAHLNALLEPERFADYCPNGLQVPGREQVDTVITGVSAGAELFERAQQAKADLILVHHGIFWDSMPAAIDQPMKRRLKLLFDANMSLAAYHLPLDAHPQVGNNALIARNLGAQSIAPFALHRGQPIGFIADLPDPAPSMSQLEQQVTDLTARTPLVFNFGPEPVQRLAIVSGAGSDHLKEAVTNRADALLTGEPAERVMGEASEHGIGFIAAGHYATETFGVKELGRLLGERFDIDHQFIDVPNPI